MSVTDLIADQLTVVRNAIRCGKKTVIIKEQAGDSYLGKVRSTPIGTYGNEANVEYQVPKGVTGLAGVLSAASASSDIRTRGLYQA